MRARQAIPQVAGARGACAAATGVANLIAQRQDLTLLDIITGLRRDRTVTDMRVPVVEVVVGDMADDDFIAGIAGRAAAIAADLFGHHDDAAAHGDDGVADGHGDINGVRAVVAGAGGPSAGDVVGGPGRPGQFVVGVLG